MKVRTNYDNTDYVIPGKLYEVVENVRGRAAFVYLEDAEEDNPDCISLGHPCPHLNCEDVWEIVEE